MIGAAGSPTITPLPPAHQCPSAGRRRLAGSPRQRLCHVARLLRRDHREQLALAPVDIPAREEAILRAPVRRLVDLAVVAQVLAIGVGHDAGADLAW